MSEYQLPCSDQSNQNTPGPKAFSDSAAFSRQVNDQPASGSLSPDADAEEDINLASESVAGEEDPGASLDISPG